jgi:hypothetical protein
MPTTLSKEDLELAREVYLLAHAEIKKATDVIGGIVDSDQQVLNLNARLFTEVNTLALIYRQLTDLGVEIPDPDPDGVFGTKSGPNGFNQ